MRANTRACFLLLAGASGTFLVAGCGTDIEPTRPAILSRPTAVAFACVGDVVFEGGTANQRIERSAAPVELCRQWLETGMNENPEGQAIQRCSESTSRVCTIDGECAGMGVCETVRPVTRPALLSFVLQSDNGTMAVLRRDIGNVIVDTDPLTPGKNAIPVGTLPIDTGVDESGCFVLSANAGTCDLTALDVLSADDQFRSPSIRRIPLLNSLGEVVDAQPAAMAMSPQSSELANECPAEPTGIAYIALPECSLVAAVDLATGTIQGGVRFNADGTSTIVDGSVSCESECGGGLGEPPDAGPGPDASDLDASTVDASTIDASTIDASTIDAGVDIDAGVPQPTPDGTSPRPVTLVVERENNQLIIGTENSPTITIVTLDPSGLPMAKRSVVLDGEVGVSKVKVSDGIPMGGNTGQVNGPAGTFQFIYAIASDRSMRVVDLAAGIECDTQVDPRYLRGETNLAFLSCMPVGGEDTPPRRAGAQTPGITIPRGSAPLDVEFATVVRNPDVPEGPTDLAGTFAFMTTSDSTILIINIDDDVYNDFESTVNPESTFISQAVPHQLRDFVLRSGSASGFDPAIIREGCLVAEPDLGRLPPRLSTNVLRAALPSQLSELKLHQAPFTQNVQCDAVNEDGEPTSEVFLSELALAAPVELREQAFPDLFSVRSEQWVLTWEGPLSRDTGTTNIDGQPVRAGVFSSSGQDFEVTDQASAFCAAGVEAFDSVVMFGCDPTQGDGQCGIGETCFVHPDTPSAVSFGTCLPIEQTEILGAQCRDFLVSRKVYSATNVTASELSLRTRRRVLDTTPLAGCESDAQCEDMALVDRQIADDSHPIEANLAPPDRDFTWTCEVDPSRASAANKCQMACETSADCEDGFACDEDFCVFGPVPPPQCMATLQRYQFRGSEALVVIGTQSGYLHNTIADPGTGECVADPNGSPLNVGRIPLSAPPCVDGDGFTDFTPNPCQTEVTQKELYFPYQVEGGRCELPADSTGPVPRERLVDAIRFSNPSLRFHLVDLSTTGDAQCRNDRAGTLPPYSGVHAGFELGIDLVGGFIPMFVQSPLDNDSGPVPARFPVAISKAFDNTLWVLDQGDSSSAIQGRVIIVDPQRAPNGFDVSAFER